MGLNYWKNMEVQVGKADTKDLTWSMKAQYQELSEKQFQSPQNFLKFVPNLLVLRGEPSGSPDLTKMLLWISHLPINLAATTSKI